MIPRALKASARLLCLAALAALAAPPAIAEEGEGARPQFARVSDRPVALVADEIAYDSNTGVLTARGAVQVFHESRTLTADEIVYDARTERISASGAITLRTETGETVYADMAELDTALRDGIVRGAKSVIAAGGARISAVEARRVEGRYNVLSKAVFSPCEVCAARPVPLWRIRARRIIHDEEARQIHYDDAYFDFMGVTLGYLPYFRHPSPEVKRATGFLRPQFENDRAYEQAVKLPYYIVIDDQSDVTLTPFISVGDGALLEIEYRRLFAHGFVDLDVSTGVTDYGGDGKGARARFGGFGAARYEAAPGYHLGFDLEIAADDPFLRRYDYTELDRLETEAFARVYDDRSYATVTAGYLQSLRVGEKQDEIPLVTPEFAARYVTAAPGVGGDLGFSMNGVGLVREEGRDVGRVTFGADWSREFILDSGLALRTFAEARADYYRIGDDPAFDDDAFRFAPLGGVEARMPFVRTDEEGGLHIVEPIVQFVLAPEHVGDSDIPNEDSVVTQFDHTNLFEIDRETGYDRFESGGRVTVGGRYQRLFAGGLSAQAAAGRIFRFDDIGDFTRDSGLNGETSDYVLAFSLSYQGWASAGANWRLSDDFGIEEVEVAARLDYDPVTLFGSYLFVDDDPAAFSFRDRSEITFGGALRLDRNWTLAADARHDFIADDFVTAGGVLSYVDECAGFDFYARRRFTETVSQPDGTSIGVRVRLFGAGGGDPARASGTCAYGAE